MHIQRIRIHTHTHTQGCLSWAVSAAVWAARVSKSQRVAGGEVEACRVVLGVAGVAGVQKKKCHKYFMEFDTMNCSNT